MRGSKTVTVEYMKCRVAKVCKKNTDGKNIPTCLPARLNCSIPGEFPYHFFKIQAVYKMPNDNAKFYGVFTTNLNSMICSAVCKIHIYCVLSFFFSRKAIACHTGNILSLLCL